ncbi:pantetheine-phosphate adenylyltransferase [Megasphaera hutchinsoni]|uniref:Phosphopantetheine adenylyltransferase n=1 Tax=Megasphaera hutchinsoni TaxID=1588748 RepID=A0A134CJB1_9FIRM|nr:MULTISPECIES: pantetheine-phosphate adenylyltransferase [Megasphaera]KXB92302.1 pantetheine-phosphate adenylyltransferase [Megasphaera hutchinsoni]MUP58728.1 pantetheine-phosphate adenylyltransferase [Veillonellaceae bacterium M2-4]PNH21826.1 pantetheine-phosphate adenylyltransferase [Megasphaera genomosp. type_2]
MRIGICPGSFDPVTNGHIDIFERGSKLVDKLIIAVFENPSKKPLFTMQEREEMLVATTKHIPQVEVVSFQGLLNEYAMQRGAKFIIRGLRALSDFEYEFQRALLMKKVEPDLETVFIMTGTQYSYISSTGIRELACFGGTLDGMVPAYVEKRLKERFKDKYKA